MSTSGASADKPRGAMFASARTAASRNHRFEFQLDLSTTQMAGTRSALRSGMKRPSRAQTETSHCTFVTDPGRGRKFPCATRTRSC